MSYNYKYVLKKYPQLSYNFILQYKKLIYIYFNILKCLTTIKWKKYENILYDNSLIILICRTLPELVGPYFQSKSIAINH